MRTILCVLLVAFLCPTVFKNIAHAQTPATGSVVISGTLQRPVYPCGSRNKLPEKADLANITTFQTRKVYGPSAVLTNPVSIFEASSNCPVYDSGQISVTVAGFTATASYGIGGAKQAEQLAMTLSAQLNSTTSPVTAVRSNVTITMTSKRSGASANYPLSTAVVHNSLFSRASFLATTSGATLVGGTNPAINPPPPVIPPPPSLNHFGTLVGRISNNTSVCSSSNDPGGNRSYCTAFFNGFKTGTGNLGAQTPVPNSPAGHVSDLSVKQLLYPGWNGRVLCHYMPWFGSSIHRSVGYDENSAGTIAAQASFMIKQGCDVVLIDYYGSIDPKHAFNLATTKAMFADVSSRAGYPLKFGIVEDKGALKGICPVSGQAAGRTVTCLQGALIKEMDYIKTNYTNSPVYWTDGGQPVVAYFGGPSDWPILSITDWDSVWSAVKAHTDNYAVPFKFVFQYGGKFTANSWDNGRYAWAQPPDWNPTQQFWWGSRSNPFPIYLDSFYSNALTHPSQLAIGALYKAFDDNNASWSGNRVIAQQCGQVLMNTAAEIRKFYSSSGPQLPYVQLVTWNDYEEGTALESGVDNCYSVTASMLGNAVAWSLVPSDPVYASTSTIDHFNVYFADENGTLYLAEKYVPKTTNSLDLSQLVPPGTWSVYVEMVGQPLIINRMSNAVTYIH